MKMKRGCLIAVAIVALIGAVALGGLILAARAYDRAHPIAHQLPYKWDSYVRPDLQFRMEPISNVIAKLNSVIRESSKGAVPEAIKLDTTPTRIIKVGSNGSLDPYMDQLIADYRENEKEMYRRGANGFESAPFTGFLDGHHSLGCTLIMPESDVLDWEPKEDALHVSRMPREMECRAYPVTDALNEFMEANRKANYLHVDCEPHVSALINATGITSWGIMVPDRNAPSGNAWAGEFRYDKVFRYLPEAGVILALATPEEHATAQERLRNPVSWNRKSPEDRLGMPAPDFKLDLLDGGLFTPSQAKGKQIVILYFWVSWYDPCRQAMPVVAEVAAAYKDKGVVLCAVNGQESPDTIRDFLKAQKLSVTVALDKDGKVFASYGAEAVNQMVIIAKDGLIRVVHVDVSPDLKKQLTDDLHALLAGKPPAASKPQQ